MKARFDLLSDPDLDKGVPPAQKRRYRVEFVETVRYTVEFATDVEIDAEGDQVENGDNDWFDAMDEACPTWSTTGGILDVTDRELLDITDISEVAVPA